MDARAARITAYSAIAVAVLFVPTIVNGVAYPMLGGDTSASELGAFLADHRTSLFITLYLSALGWGGLLIVFGGGLFAVLRQAEGGSGVWSTIAFGACVATAVTILAVYTLLVALVHRAPALDPTSLPVLFDAMLVGNLITAYPNAVYVVAAGIVILETRVMPYWIAYAAFLVAGVHLLSAASLARSGALAPSGVLPSLAPLSHFAWLICVAAVLLRAQAATSPRGVRTG
jgi:hypothetical protein